MKILITGSNGFIGSRLTAELSRRELTFDVLERQIQPSLSRETTGQTSLGLRIAWPDEIQQLDLTPYQAIVHLATPIVTQETSPAFLEQNCLRPIEYFLKRILEVNPDCSFIFVTSQSAKPSTPSLYGHFKWKAEEIIRSHPQKWTILRPGLVIGPGGKGLFNRILQFVKISPIVPLIGLGQQSLQPIGLNEVVQALITIATDPEKYSHQDLPIAGPAVTLKCFLEQGARVLGRRRIFLPIPISVVNLGLAILEKILPNPGITRANLLGLLSTELLDSHESCLSLGLSIPPLTETLQNAISAPGDSPLEKEAMYFYRRLFGRYPCSTLIRRYIAAHSYCCFAQDSRESLAVQKICSRALDFEAIEFVIRSRKSVLSKKLTLLTYLAELEAENYPIFVNENRNIIFGYYQLAKAALSAPWKFAKGKYLIWRYDLV